MFLREEAKVLGSFDDETKQDEEETRGLCDVLQRLKAVVYKSFTTTLDDVESRSKLLDAVHAREHDALEDRNTLETELSLVKREKRRVLETLELKVERLETELAERKSYMIDELANLSKRTTSK